MLQKNKTILILSLIVICCLLVGVFAIRSQVCAAEISKISPAAKLYELSDNSNYVLDEKKVTKSFTYGKSSLGSFSIHGAFDETSSYRGKTAYGVSGNISFSYSYDGYLQGNAADKWNLNSDTSTSVAGCSLTGSIGKGVVLVQKSSNGTIYSNAVNPVTDFFKDKSNKNNFYTTDGSDVARGMYYRVIIAYETCRKTGTSGIWPFQKDVYEYKNQLEVYEFYICRNDAVISVHNLAVDADSLQADGYTLDVQKHGETLLDGSVTTKGFSIDKLGTSYLVSVQKDNESAQYIEDGARFTDDGKYVITTTTKLGKTKKQTVYIFNGGEDKGFLTYFDTYLVRGHRVYRDEPIPVYAKDSVAYLKATGEDVPFITGALENITTGEKFTFRSDTRGEQSFPLSVGTYQGVFYSGDPDLSSGSYYRYSFQFIILDAYSSPYVNYENLMSTQNLEDLAVKHYEVAYPMTNGGYVFVCFSLSSFQEAVNYAYEIEGRFIEKAEDGGLYYKSEKNPNKKEKYYDPIELTRVRNIYARQNVEYNYFNAVDQYTYRTLDSVDELENLNLPESVKVFASKEEKDKMIDRKPYINNFIFIHVADFDVTSVQAYCYRNGKTYTIEFGKPVSEQLSASSKYKITETNEYGDKKEYDVYFMLENLTRSEWEICYNGVSSTLSLSVYDLESGVKAITADSITLKSVSNVLDPDSIVTIKAPDVYSFEIKCMMSELKNVALYKKGQYEIIFVDRVGNSYKLVVYLTGRTRYSSLNADAVCYTQFYNSVYMNAKSLDEEYMINIEELERLMDMDISEAKYTANSYQVYKIRWSEAESVYNNPDASQEEIDLVALNLQKAIENLIPSADKTALKAELDLYESIDKNQYTTASFNAYTNIYNEAKVLFAGDRATGDEISVIVARLKAGYQGLVLRGDKTALKAVLEAARAVDCSRYTPKSVEALEEAFCNAYEVYCNKDALQSTIAQAMELVNSHIDALVLQADFSSLGTLIGQVRQIDPKKYNTATIVKLRKIYGESCEVLNDRNSTQEEVNIALANLQIAYDGLIEIGEIDKLRSILREIKELNAYLYAADGIRSLKNQYDSAIAMLDSDYVNAEQISAEITVLENLKGQLSLRKDKEELYAYLLHCKDVDLSAKSKKTAEPFKTAYDNALQVLQNLDASEADVSTSMTKLKTSEKELKTVTLTWWGKLLIGFGVVLVAATAALVLKKIHVRNQKSEEK